MNHDPSLRERPQRVLEVEARPLRYVLLELLGKGGAAEAWRARRESSLLVEEVCIKRSLRVVSAAARRALLEEARLLSRIRHANVVSLLGVELEASGAPFLVLELVRGTDLRVIGRGLAERGERLEPSVVASVGVDLCRAIAAAQRAVAGGVVHRDVTPHNVLVSVDGQIKLADFGIARAFDRESWTRTGVLKGKAAYVSPEQLAGEALDERSDLFAVGVVLFELLAGRRPFRGGATATLHAIATGQRPRLASLRTGASKPLEEAVEALLETRPSERPPDAEQAARLLAPSADPHHAAERLRRLARVPVRPGLARAKPSDCARAAPWR